MLLPYDDRRCVARLGARLRSQIGLNVRKTFGIAVSMRPWVGRNPLKCTATYRGMRWKGVGTNRHAVDGKNGFVVSARFLPRTLEEQEGHDEFTELDAQFTNGNVKRIFVTDVSGRKWLVSRSAMKKLVADAKKYS